MNRLISAILLFVCACGQVADPQVKENYTSAVRSLGLTGIYPPREEFQVGDVYFTASIPRTNFQYSSYVGDIPELRKAAAEFLETRIVFDHTRTIPNLSQNPPADQPDLFDSEFRTRGDYDHVGFESNLPIVAFPSIELGAADVAALSATSLVQALGFSRSERTQVELQFPTVTKYYIPASSAQRLSTSKGTIVETAQNLFNELDETNVSSRCENFAVIDVLRKIDFDRREGKFSSQKLEDFELGLIIITSVYLTRKIDYLYSNSEINALGLQLAGTPLQSTVVPQLPPPPTSAEGSLVTPDAQLTTIQATLDRLTAVTEERSQGLRLGNWTGRGILFEETYRRPVSIAYEAVPITFPKSSFVQGITPNVDPSDLERRPDGSRPPKPSEPFVVTAQRSEVIETLEDYSKCDT